MLGPRPSKISQNCNTQQQYHVVPFHIGWVQVGLGFRLTGKLGVAWVVHGYMGGGGGGDVLVG